MGWLLWLPILVLTPDAAQGPAGSTLTVEQASAMVAEIGKTVEELRGQKFKRHVPVKVVDDAAARAHFRARLGKLWPEAQMRFEQKVYSHLGLLPPGSDILGTLLDMLEEQAWGYYDPDTDTFYVLDDMPRGMAPMIMAHELTHALDDQHFGIDQMLEKAQGDDDRQSAMSAVVEGSGTLVMSVFLIREIGAGRLKPEALLEFEKTEAGRAERLKQAPPLLQRSLVAPYILGQAFLLRGNPMGMIAGIQPQDVDRAFREPPTSGEQILHPEKYWDAAKKDPPRAMTLPELSSALGGGWSLVAEGTLGEIVLAILVGVDRLNLQSVEIANPASWTNEAASGWGGDLYHHYVNGPKSVTILATLWDTEHDAEEFEKGLRPVEGRQAWRRGEAVVLAGGDAADRAAAVATAALDAIAPPRRR